ncbi:hypothetical protein HYV89_02355 [Candidatus Woesearchaeota archaeon]|nr:hypothetical protein [Candidatus Woesearchaeota archaeon]
MISLESHITPQEYIRDKLIQVVPAYIREEEILDNNSRRGRRKPKNGEYEHQFLDDATEYIVNLCRIKFSGIETRNIIRLLNHYLYTPLEEDF